MVLTLTAVSVMVLSVLVVTRIKRKKDRRVGTAQHLARSPSYVADLRSGTLLFDVRQPLDLLGHSAIIPGAKWIPPQELLKNPALIPQEEDSVVYCTCPGDKTSRAVLRQAQAMHFLRVKFLKSGLAAWKAKGYPVEPYNQPFHLDSVT